MEYDVEIISTFLPLLIVGVLLIIFLPSIIKGDKTTVVRSLLGGLFLLLSSTFASSLISGQIDLEYIFNFLSLKKVGIRSYRLAAASGYLLIVWGLTSLFVIQSKKVKKNEEV